MKPSLFLAALFLAGSLHAAPTLPRFFSDGMVLQRERDAAIWGKAAAGEEVTVTFKGKTATAKAGDDGKWRAAIATGPADAAGSVLTVAAGGTTVEIRDVLVGEVWFASGQSNMVFTVERAPAYESIIKETTLPVSVSSTRRRSPRSSRRTTSRGNGLRLPRRPTEVIPRSPFSSRRNSTRISAFPSA